MQFYDTHMHSYLSFDCQENPENYIGNTTEKLIFTDHLDLENPVNYGQDDIPDFSELISWQRALKEEYDVDLLLGVEVGYVPGQQERLEEILSAFKFDLKLLSTHQNGHYDYMDQTTETPETMMTNYINQLLESVTRMQSCQIMTHFDYGFRIHDLKVSDLKPYEYKLTQILEKCIKNDLSFELNSKSLYKYNNLALYEWTIQKYQSMGGKLFSLGSDAHIAKDQFLGFEQSIELLQKYGVTHVTQYKKQKLYLYPLNEVIKAL